jgi:Protein of unknown function (DUF2442).
MALEITDVNTLDSYVLDIALSNGSQILLNIAPLVGCDPAYSVLRKLPLPRPKTDGSSVYWPSGPRLPIADIFALLRQAEQKQAVNKHRWRDFK